MALGSNYQFCYFRGITRPAASNAAFATKPLMLRRSMRAAVIYKFAFFFSEIDEDRFS